MTAMADDWLCITFTQMYPFVCKVNLHTVDIVDFFILIDFLYFCQDSIYIDFRSQVDTVLSYEVRRISGTELANLFSFVSQMAKE